jgi:hypothetical protein
MEEIIESMFTVADWFVMEGADVRYAENLDPHHTGLRAPYIHEARLDDLQVFIGEPVTACDVDRVVEVAIALRTRIPLPVEIVEELVSGRRGTTPRGVDLLAFSRSHQVHII